MTTSYFELPENELEKNNKIVAKLDRALAEYDNGKIQKEFYIIQKNIHSSSHITIDD